MKLNFRKKEKLYQYLSLGFLLLLVIIFILSLVHLMAQISTALKPGQPKDLNVSHFNLEEWRKLQEQLK